MTCIVGIEHDGKVYMGGDSAAADGWEIRRTTAPKVFKLGHLLIGYTSSFRMGQALQYATGLPEQDEGQSNYSYLVEKFVPFTRNVLREAGWIKTENSRDEGGQFLVGINGQLFEIEWDFSVLRFEEGYGAVGCGTKYALGALKVIFDHGRTTFDIRKDIQIALETAEYFSNGVIRPFHYEVIE